MKKSYFLVPARKGLKVPNPGTQAFLKEEGELVEASSYWQRRIDSKEVKKQEHKSKAEHKDKDSQGSK